MTKIFPNSNNQNLPPQFHLGKLWHKKGKLTQAIKHYQQAIQTQPNYLDSYLELGSLLLQQRKIESAIDIYRQAENLSSPENYNYSSQILGILTPTKVSTRNHNILLYTDRADIYGAEQINHALMCGLKKAGKNITCVQPENDNYLFAARRTIDIDHYWLEKYSIYGYEKDNFRVALPQVFTHTSEPTRIFASTKPDLIIFADSCPFSSLVAKQIAIAMNIPYITLIHCVKSEWANDYSPFIDRLTHTYQKAKAVLAVSSENLDLLHELFGLPAEKGQVMYNGRPQQFFTRRCLDSNKRIRNELNIPENAIVSFTSARLDEVKGYQYQLEAIKLLQKTEIWSQLYFVWAGEGLWSDKLKQEVAELNLQQQISFIGLCDNIAELLNIADIFVLPSEAEGMPLSVMEAMAKGLPVIASRVSGIPEELGDTGQLISDPNINPQATIDELVKTIQAWVKDDKLREKIANSCKQRAMLLFSEEKMIDNYLNLRMDN